MADFNSKKRLERDIFIGAALCFLLIGIVVNKKKDPYGMTVADFPEFQTINS